MGSINKKAHLNLIRLRSKKKMVKEEGKRVEKRLERADRRVGTRENH